MVCLLGGMILEENEKDLDNDFGDLGKLENDPAIGEIGDRIRAVGTTPLISGSYYVGRKRC